LAEKHVYYNVGVVYNDNYRMCCLQDGVILFWKHTLDFILMLRPTNSIYNGWEQIRID